MEETAGHKSHLQKYLNKMQSRCKLFITFTKRGGRIWFQDVIKFTIREKAMERNFCVYFISSDAYLYRGWHTKVMAQHCACTFALQQGSSLTSFAVFNGHLTNIRCKSCQQFCSKHIPGLFVILHWSLCQLERRITEVSYSSNSLSTV